MKYVTIEVEISEDEDPLLTVTGSFSDREDGIQYPDIFKVTGTYRVNRKELINPYVEMLTKQVVSAVFQEYYEFQPLFANIDADIRVDRITEKRDAYGHPLGG